MSSRISSGKPRKRDGARGLVIVGIFALVMSSGSSWAQTGEADAGPAENPLVPLVEDLGRRLGLELRVGKIALNPFKGVIVLRQLEAESKLQGPFLKVDRLAINGALSSESQEVDLVTVEGGHLSLDVAKNGLAEKHYAGRHKGKVKKLQIDSLDLSLRASGIELLTSKSLEVTASDVVLCEVQQGEPICADIEVTDGAASLLGGASKAEGVRLSGRILGHRLEVESLSGALDSGSFSCAGVLFFFGTQPKRPGIDLRCDLERTRIVREELLDVVVTGEVRLRGSPAHLKLTGTVDAVGGKRLRAGIWGKNTPQHPLASDLVVKVRAGRSHVIARVTSSKGKGRVTISGSRGKSPAAAEKLLEQLESDSSDE